MESCIEARDALLYLELEHPSAFVAAHHLMIAAFSLQHPEGATIEALAMWRRLIADVLDGSASTPELLRRAGRAFAGSVRVIEPGAQPPAWWPRQWPTTVQDVVPGEGEMLSSQSYVDRVRAWAASIRATLDRVSVL